MGSCRSEPAGYLQMYVRRCKSTGNANIFSEIKLKTLAFFFFSSKKMSCSIELEMPQENKEVLMSPVASPKVTEAIESINDQVVEAESEPLVGIETQRVDDGPSDQKQRSRKNSTTCEEIGKNEIETASDPVTKAEPPIKSDNRKRKRSLENGIPVTDKEIQRRSTRSRAYAQQAEEDIYSLRAELRSFLPTSLL